MRPVGTASILQALREVVRDSSEVKYILLYNPSRLVWDGPGPALMPTATSI
jgi:hypothetical protein